MADPALKAEGGKATGGSGQKGVGVGAPKLFGLWILNFRFDIVKK